MLGRNFLNADPRDSRLLATEAPFGPLVLQEAANEVRPRLGGFNNHRARGVRIEKERILEHSHAITARLPVRDVTTVARAIL